MQHQPRYEEENLDYINLGERILIARNRANLSQDTLAKKVDISRVTLYRYEKGLSNPDVEHLGKIADAVNHPIHWFYQ